MSKISHLLELILMLQYKEFSTASELADILKVDKKTIYRYIETLQMSNIPVESKKGRYGGFYIKEGFYIKYPKITQEELQALILASKILTKEKGFFFSEELQSAVIKIKSHCISEDRDFYELKENISFKINEAGSLENFNDIISKINFAMTKGKVIHIEYFSINKNIQYEVDINPYTIFFRNGIWYLVAYCHDRKKEKTFNISRIKQVSITKDIFIKPKHFNLKEYFNNPRGIHREEDILVKIKFDKAIGAFIEEGNWLPEQQIEKLKDGSIIFQGYVNELGEIKRWILGFGSTAEVLEPSILRDEIKLELSNVLGKYLKKV